MNAPPRRALAVTVSNRASAGVYRDTGGPLLAEGLAALGFETDGPRVVPDGEPVEAVLREAVAASYDVVVTTGGTGISPTDRTPEMTRRVLAELGHEVPGIPEAIRAEGRAKVPTAALSRGLAGVAGGTLIVNLPGSSGGVRDGLAVLGRLLVHAVDQIHGGDHPRTGDGTGGTGDGVTGDGGSEGADATGGAGGGVTGDGVTDDGTGGTGGTGGTDGTGGTGGTGGTDGTSGSGGGRSGGGAGHGTHG
ncbi:MogA/MoaB family molybdenum cofactor biosynthesis protein [Streptomyces lycii]|uniref:MogA/MoaB family molybdenum cofactor biosynthesis protein n=1 Tax=Streptomyces lycii TaxID=2654337 RepID=A0ABQ7FIU9_9ACTN|nr:MogA/MoaB family molybdenum cofactor biosynthesis protein [Streptomyces lycii]